GTPHAPGGTAPRPTTTAELATDRTGLRPKAERSDQRHGHPTARPTAACGRRPSAATPPTGITPTSGPVEMTGRGQPYGLTPSRWTAPYGPDHIPTAT